VQYAATSPDFGGAVADLAARVTQAKAQYPAGQVAIYYTAFDEATNLFDLAQAQPVLASTAWYGSDGVANSADLAADPIAAQFASRVVYPNPNLGLSAQLSSRWKPIADQISAASGITP